VVPPGAMDAHEGNHMPTAENPRDDNLDASGEPTDALCAPVSDAQGASDTHVAEGPKAGLTDVLAANLPSHAEEDAPAPPTPAKKTKKPRQSCTLKTAMDEFDRDCPDPDMHFITTDDPVHEWAEKVGVPNHFLWLAWNEFERRFLDTQKRQKDWRAHFRNACRGNWFHLWYIADDGSYQLTVAGIQLDRELAAEKACEREMGEYNPDVHEEDEMPYDAPRQTNTYDDGKDHSAELMARLFGEGGNPLSADKWLN